MSRIFQEIVLFSRSSPQRKQLVILGKADSIRDVGIVVLDGFNGPGATIRIGTDVDPEAVVRASDVNAAVAADYRIDRTYVASDPEAVQLFLDVAGSTSGSARVYFTVMSWAERTG